MRNVRSTTAFVRSVRRGKSSVSCAVASTRTNTSHHRGSVRTVGKPEAIGSNWSNWPEDPLRAGDGIEAGGCGATHHSERTAKISRFVSVSKSHRQETRTDLPPGEPAAESESPGEARIQPGTKWPAKRLWKRRSGIPSGFPLSHSHNNNKPSTVTYQMARRGALGLHF